MRLEGRRRDATSGAPIVNIRRMWTLSGLSWKQMAIRVWREIQADDVFGNAAKLGYYFLLALFPLLILVTSIIGLVIGSGTGLRHALFNYLSQVMPSSAFQLIDKTMWEVSSASGAGKISFGLLAALWAAASGVGAMMESLNSAYDSTETRSWWKQRLIALNLTVALSFLIIGAVVVIFGGSKIAEHLGAAYGFSDTFVITWKIFQWPIALAFMLLAFALIYYLAPDMPNQKWKWITPGSVIGIVLWLLVSFGFKGYLHYFDSYSKTYGSLGAVIVLMLWLYLTGAAVLIGGEVNAEIENAATERVAVEAKQKAKKS